MNCAHIVRRLPLDSILIDDNEDLKENWESRGGIFVHHTNTERTLRKLKEHGILLNDREVSRSDAMKGGAESLLQHFRLTLLWPAVCITDWEGWLETRTSDKRRDTGINAKERRSSV
jgi:hypothetical protein